MTFCADDDYDDVVVVVLAISMYFESCRFLNNVMEIPNARKHTRIHMSGVS
jgi:hypothetical protein